MIQLSISYTRAFLVTYSGIAMTRFAVNKNLPEHLYLIRFDVMLPIPEI